MKPSPPTIRSQTPLPVDTAVRQMRVLQGQGQYQEALDISLQIARAHPDVAEGWSAAAINCVRLDRWQDAIGYGQTALAHGGATNNALHDALAHAHGKLGQWDAARRHGLQSLEIRDRHFGGDPVIPHEPGPMPPLPSAQTREHNIIAFSLFGGDSKYCETAILNVQDQPDVYSDWVCRFYVDGTVPENVISRLQKGGAQVVSVDGPAAQWPGEMWRFLALNDPQAHRILFRDADSLISRREANAVGQWLTSGKRFHMMRDIGSATELMLAGLWGVVAGSLPPLEQLMQRFMSAPLASRHFADQYFLRQYVWPYARASLMQHDSIFGFLGGIPFPDGARPDDLHGVGYSEGAGSFTATCNLPDGSAVIWELYQIIEKLGDGGIRARLICAYPGTVKNGVVKAHIPVRYARWIEQGAVHVRLRVNRAA
jgi:hypothetical protein